MSHIPFFKDKILKHLLREMVVPVISLGMISEGNITETEGQFLNQLSITINRVGEDS